MSFFDTLLKNRGLSHAPIPLWKLKVTDEEYEELKDSLFKVANAIYGGTSFRRLDRECALLVSEYWRRDYTDGPHKVQSVYDTLKNGHESRSFDSNIDYFYEAAKRGAVRLGVEMYRGDSTQYLDSMLYQGGLPMRLVTQNAKNSVWDRFTRGLVNRHIDFEELQLGKIATVSRSLKEYCTSLIEAIEKQQFLLMPFYCKDDTDPWFRALQTLAHQEKTRQRQLHPFSLDWEFEVDERGGKFSTKFIVKGLQRLPEEFLDAQQLSSQSFFSAQVRVNGKAIDTFDYQNRFCRYNVLSKHSYHDGDVVSLYLHDKQEPLLSDDLDLTVPHLLYREKEGKYSLGNKIGTNLSLLIIPKGWEIVGDPPKEDSLVWEEKAYRCVFIREGFEESITLRGADGEITFGANTHLYWSEIASSPLYLPDIIEPVYDAKNIRVSLCSDEGNSPQIARDNDIEYRSKGESQWTSHPSYGEIFARVKGRNGEYVTPVRFINVGELSVVLLSADNESCSLKMTWPHGSVHCDEGVRKTGGIWKIEKSACSDTRRIHFSFVPKGHSQAQFKISIRAPFKDFSIMDSDGKPVLGSCTIPYGDLDKYQYHLVGQGLKGYSYGDIERELRWEADKLYVYENGHQLRPIPYEGSLLSLFDSREAIRSLLDKTAKSILNASVKISLEIDAFRRMILTVKESPYRIRQSTETTLAVQLENGQAIDYSHALNLFKLDDPTEPQVTLPFSEENGFTLPESVSSWGKILVTGRTRGRILPALVETERILSSEERISSRREAIACITDEISEAKLGGETWNRIVNWFYLSQKEDIPASSILDLYCLAHNEKGLLTLAFQLYLNCKGEEERDTLKGQLISMGTDLAFQWYWLRPFSNSLMFTIQSVIDWYSPFLKGLYVDWAISRQHDLTEVMYDISDDNVFMDKVVICMTDLLGEFDVWLKDLYATSILDTYGTYDEDILRDVADRIAGKKECIHVESFDEVFIEQNQNLEDPAVNAFFERFDEPWKPRNERWLHQRVNAMAAHFKHKVNLFSDSDDVRRSILFCRKSSPKAFLLELNNKLAK